MALFFVSRMKFTATRYAHVVRRLRKSNCDSRVTMRTRISCVASSASSRFHNILSERPKMLA
jgi:hypothetical protein